MLAGERFYLFYLLTLLWLSLRNQLKLYERLNNVIHQIILDQIVKIDACFLYLFQQILRQNES